MLSYEAFTGYMNQFLAELQAKPVSNWAKEDVQWAIDKGLLRGDGSETPNYMPQSFLTREAAVALLHRMSDLLDKEKQENAGSDQK